MHLTPNSRKNVEQNAGTKEMEHENVTNNVPDNRNDVQVPTCSKEIGLKKNSLSKTKCSGVDKSKNKF